MHGLDTTVTYDRQTATIRKLALAGMITPNHSQSYNGCCVIRSAWFADFEDRGSCRRGVEISERAYIELEELLLLRSSIAKGDIRLGRCRTCKGLILINPFAGSHRTCAQCTLDG